MKVGIVTFHWAYNYGAVLQSYALQEEVSRLGHDVEFIDYNPFTVPKEKGKGLNFGIADGSLVRRLKKAVGKIKNANLSRKHGTLFFQGFDQFRKDFLHGSGKIDLTLADYDVIIVGSDQVWNASWIGESISYYYLADFHDVTKISYAACVGNEGQPEQYSDEIKTLLNDFSSISVRNKVTYEFVKKVSGYTPEMVCDPTFLHSFTSISLKGSTLRDLPEQFILVYALGEHIKDLGTQITSQVKDSLHLPVVSISSVFHTGWTFKAADHIIYDATPMEWLWLFEHAAFICTDSFHGLVFSMKYKKPLLGYRDDGWRSFRLTDLMQQYRLNDRLLFSYDRGTVNTLIHSDIDYEYVEQNVEKEVKHSVLFLKKALDELDFNT
jgi:hypothetical protein